MIMKATYSFSARPGSKAGFTLTDLLMLVVTMGILGLLLLPALASTKPNSATFQCLENERQLVRAWQMYAEDFNGSLVASLGNTGPVINGTYSIYNGRPSWMTGVIGQSPGSWDVSVVIASPLWNYTGKNASIFRCPADPTTVTVAGVTYPRTRSVSMSQVFDFGQWLAPANWRTYGKTSEIVRPKNTFVFIDESPKFMNDGAFAVQCDGYNGTAGTPQIIDLPATFHNKSAGLSFADGHAELHRWTGPTILSTSSSTTRTGPNLADFNYLAENSTVHK